MPYRVVVLLALLLAGCGQKGSLYLPPRAPAAPAAAPVARPPAATVPDDTSGAAPAPAPPSTTP